MKKNKELFDGFLTVALLVLFAFILHSVARRVSSPVISLFLNFMRTVIYIGLFSFWGVTACRKVVQERVKNYLAAVSVLMVLWIIIREFKFRFISDVNIERYLWYAYYIPLLLTPLIALTVSVYLGKGNGYRVSKKIWLLYFPTFVLIALFLTNDFHQLAFYFGDSEIWSEHGNYAYGAVFYFSVAWGIVCSVFAMMFMIVKFRLNKSSELILFPLLPIALIVAYVILYTLKVPFISEQGDIAVFFGLVFISFFEICIRLGLIPSNTRYFDLFRASKDLSLQIVDNDYNVKYSSSAAEKFFVDTLVSAESAPVLLDGKYRLHNMSIGGGHAIWVEDISELFEKSERLKIVRAELKDRNEIIKLEYEDIKKQKAIEEQNRLYDLLQRVTQRQMESIERIAERYEEETDASKKRMLLSYIVVLGSYIKRRKDFLLSLEDSSVLSPDKLKSALEESVRSLKLTGISGGYLVRIEGKSIRGDILTTAYDFFEDVLENVLERVKYVNVVVVSEQGAIRITVIVDCRIDGGRLTEKYPDAVINRDGDGGARAALLIDGRDGV